MFKRACIHCLSTIGGERIPRQFRAAVYGTKPNDLLQFDYIEFSESNSGDDYVLMLRDDHSGSNMAVPLPVSELRTSSALNN